MTAETGTPAAQPPEPEPAEDATTQDETTETEAGEAEIAGAAQDEAQEAEAPGPGLDTTLRGSRVLADLGGEEHWRGLLAAFDNAMPESLKACYRKRTPLPCRRPAPAEPLPPLPDWQDSAMTRYELAHEDRPEEDGQPVRHPSRLRGLLARRRQRSECRHRDVYPLAAPPPPLAAPEPSWAETTAHDGMPRIPRFVPRGAELASDRAYTPHGTHRRSVWET